MKLAIIVDVPWPFRRIVDSRSRSRGTSCQAPELTDLFGQPLMNQLGRHAETDIVMHQMQQRDQGVRLATAVGDLELVNGFDYMQPCSIS